jgi:hypothetical protein
VGLLLCIPTVAWWGTTIHIHPVHRLVLGESLSWQFPPEARWTLPIAEAQAWRRGEESWQDIEEVLPKGKVGEGLSFRWKPISLWAMIRMELIP